MTEIIPPTLERLAKGDLENWKHTGRSVVQLNHDRLLALGIIDDEQWRLCNQFRVMWQAFKNPLETRAMQYGSVPDGGSIEGWNIDRLTLSDKYQKAIQSFGDDTNQPRVLSLVINDEQSFRDVARIMAMRRCNVKSLFFVALHNLKKHLHGGQ